MPELRPPYFSASKSQGAFSHMSRLRGSGISATLLPACVLEMWASHINSFGSCFRTVGRHRYPHHACVTKDLSHGIPAKAPPSGGRLSPWVAAPSIDDVPLARSDTACLGIDDGGREIVNQRVPIIRLSRRSVGSSRNPRVAARSSFPIHRCAIDAPRAFASCLEPQ